MMNKVKTWKQNLQHFEGPTVEQDSHFARMNEAGQATYLRYVSRANMAYARAKKYGIPKDYEESLKTIKEDVKRVNVDIPINYEELYALDTALSYTIWEVDQFSKLKITIKTQKRPNWQIKQYRVGTEEWPRATREFNNPRFLRLTQSDKWTEGLGLYIGVQMSWQTIKESAGGLWDPLSVLNQKAGEKFGLMKSRMGFRGFDSYKLMGDAGRTPAFVKATGLLNDSNIQAFTAGDLVNLDANITGDNEVNDSIWTALSKFNKCYQPHKKWLITTRGVAAETILESHRDSYAQKLDLHRIVDKYFDTGILAGWLVTDQMLNAAASTKTTQSIAIVGVGPSLVKQEIIYPTQRLSMNDKKFAGDFKEVLLWAGAIQYMNVDTSNNVFPATIDSSITSTVAGAQIPQGIFDVYKWAKRTTIAGTGIQ
jgi:hypothetical protein